MSAKFIVLEGIDGSGTTTQAQRLGEWMRARGFSHHVTREPSHGRIGQLIRTSLSDESRVHPRTLALLFAADRLDHIEREISPALARGVHVLSDRYVMSSLVYQTLDLPREDVVAYNAHARTPDLTLLLDVSVAEAERRRALRGGPTEIFDDRSLQERIAIAYSDEARRLAKEGQRVDILDGARSPDEVHAAIVRSVESCLDRP